MSETIVVTGGCGYLGSEVVRQLASAERDDWTIRVFDSLEDGGHSALMGLPKSASVQFVEGNLFDPGALRFALSDADWVIHLAGITRTPFSFDRPSWLEQVNRWGTARVVELCLEAGVKGLVYSSTASVYGPGGPFGEGDPCRPINAYAQSKQHGEKIVAEATARGLTALVLRLGTVFGVAPSMRFDAIANRFAFLAGIGRPVTIFGSGQQRRPTIHVSDAARLIVELVSLPADESVVLNVSAGNPSVEELTRALRSVVPDLRVQYTEQDVLTFLSLEVDNARLRGIGFEPKVSFEEGLAEIVDRFSGLVPAVYPSLDG